MTQQMTTKVAPAEKLLKLLKMFSGFLMTLNTHCIKEGSKEDKPDEAKVKVREKEKEKAEEEEDTSSQETQRPRKRKKKRPLSHGGRRALTW